MATKTYKLTYAALGADLDNFSITSNAGLVTPSTATRAQLLVGITLTLDSAATLITIISSGWCNNATNIPLTPAIVSSSCYDVVIQEDGFGFEGGNWSMTFTSFDGTVSTSPLGDYASMPIDSNQFRVLLCSRDFPSFRYQGLESAPPSWINISTGGSCTSTSECSVPV